MDLKKKREAYFSLEELKIKLAYNSMNLENFPGYS